MTKILLYMTAAAALTLAGQAMAQTPAKGSSAPPPAGQTPPVNPPANTAPAATPTPPASAASAPAASADSASKPASASASANLTVGLAVKDSTGAAIGQIADLKPDASGKQMATIKMGSDTFAVAASSLAVQDGAAVINLTQQQLRDMIKKPAS